MSFSKQRGVVKREMMGEMMGSDTKISFVGWGVGGGGGLCAKVRIRESFPF